MAYYNPIILYHMCKLVWVCVCPLSDLHSYLIIWGQAISAGDNKKLHNKNCDEEDYNPLGYDAV
jgi:hypothetical protein